MLSAKLLDWQAAGLIDADAAARIAAYEAGEGRPVAVRAAIGLGVLAFALGAVLIVASGWDRIPVTVKLGAQLGLTALAAAAAAWRGRGRGPGWTREAALTLLAALTLAGLALHAQVWQLSGPLWLLFGWWVLLAAPALMLGGATRLTAWAVAAMLTALALGYALRDGAPGLAPGDLEGRPLALPPLLLLTTLWWPGLPPQFRDGLREAGLTLLLGCASFAHFAWARAITPADAVALAAALAVPVILTAGVAVRADSAALRAAAAASLISLLVLVPHGGTVAARAAGALAFVAMWALVARGAALSGWRGLFGVAIAAIAFRLLVVYFELFGSLATTGLGLAVGGALTIALALGWARVVRRTA